MALNVKNEFVISFRLQGGGNAFKCGQSFFFDFGRAVIKQGVSLKFKDDSLSIGSERNFVFGFHRLDIVTELNHHHFNRTRLVFLFADTFVKAGLDLFIFGGIGR